MNEFSEFEEIDWDNGKIKPTIYFAHYIATGNRAPMRSREMVQEYIRHIEHSIGDTALLPHKVINFFIPVQDGNSRVELLYPGPVISKAKLDEYTKRLNDFIYEVEHPF